MLDRGPHGDPAGVLVPALRLKVGAWLRLRPLQESVVAALGCLQWPRRPGKFGSGTPLSVRVFGVPF